MNSLAILLALMLSKGLHAPDTVPAIQSTSNFDIDGTGKASAWEKASWMDLERRKGSAPYQTRVKLLYSDTGLYALYHCEDKKITATFEEDFANLWHEDVVEMFLWTDESVPLYFEYEISPLNYELPILVPNLSGRAYGWRPWHYEGARKTRHATHVTRDGQGQPTGWTAEFFIPWALLSPLQNVPPVKGTTWRINLYRIDHDTGTTTWSWKPIEKNFHDFRLFGAIRFD